MATHGRQRTRYRLLVLLSFLSVLLIAPTGVFALENQSHARVPDVIVWVDTSLPGANRVSLTYAKIVRRAEVDAQLAQLLKETGWTAANTSISDAGSGSPGEAPMTSVEFSTPMAVDLNSGTLPVEPLVKALKNLRTIEILYMVPAGFNFVGLEEFENKYVRIRLERGTNMYHYFVDVKSSRFDALGLPATGSERETEQTAARRPGMLVLVLVVVLALLTGMVTFLLASSIARSGRRNRNQRS